MGDSFNNITVDMARHASEPTLIRLPGNMSVGAIAEVLSQAYVRQENRVPLHIFGHGTAAALIDMMRHRYPEMPIVDTHRGDGLAEMVRRWNAQKAQIAFNLHHLGGATPENIQLVDEVLGAAYRAGIRFAGGAHGI